jgi:E3 ubiquitin-protein ligase HERC4
MIDGQLGHGKGRTRPEKVEGLDHSPIVEVRAGYAHTIAVDKWGAVFTWGSDSHGQLGLQNEKQEDKLVNRPRMVKSLSTKVAL